MFAGLQSPLCQRMMSEDGGCQNHRIYLRVAQDFVGIARNLNTRVAFAGSGAPLGAQIGASLNLHPIRFMQVAKQIGSPIAVTDQAYFHLHMPIFKS